MVYSVTISVPSYPSLDVRCSWREKNEIQKEQLRLKLIVIKRGQSIFIKIYAFIHMRT